MSYDLAVWNGPHPTTDSEATRAFKRLRSTMDADAPPSEAIRRYVDELQERWPDLTDLDDDDVDVDDSPWADGPVLGNATGDVIYFSTVYSRAEEAVAHCAAVAQSRGLVCYDPQLARLLTTPLQAPAHPLSTSPAPEAVRRPWWRRWSR